MFSSAIRHKFDAVLLIIFEYIALEVRENDLRRGP